MEGSDALLAARLAAGDDRALAEVFDQLASSVHGGALRILGNGSAAHDVVQDVFVELWSHPDRYDPALPVGQQLDRRPHHRRGFRRHHLVAGGPGRFRRGQPVVPLLPGHPAELAAQQVQRPVPGQHDQVGAQ